MKVYILRGIYDYEGETILNVFNNLESAEESKKEEQNNKLNSFDDYEIIEHEVLN